MPSPSFPRPGSWTINLSDAEAEIPNLFPKGTKVEIAEDGDGFAVTVRQGTEPAQTLPDFKSSGASLVGAIQNLGLELRVIHAGTSKEALCGVLIDDDRGDGATGVWTAEEDTRPPDDDSGS